jgi:Photosynthetic reaction centre cytochrome C subunit
MRKILFFSGLMIVVMVSSMLVLDAGVLWGQEDATDSPSIDSKGKSGINLQILSIDKRAELRDYMINLTKTLGTDCKFCHNIRDFPSDKRTQKTKTREMLSMIKDINGNYFKESKQKITCFTCHAGRKQPVNSFAELKKVQEEEAKQDK